LDDDPQSSVAPYIYRVGRSCPVRKSFYMPNLSGLLNLARNRGGTGLTGEGPVHPACRSWRSHISLIQTPIWTFHIWILIYSMRPIQWWSPNRISRTLTTPIWPVGPTILTGRMIPANFACEHMPPVFWQRIRAKKYLFKLKST
jgi:hypothetical protein